jgi:phytoene synthase
MTNKLNKGTFAHDIAKVQNETLKPQVSLAVNGKSFYWASHFLSAQMGYNAARLYAFCRLLDDMADGDISDGPARLARIHVSLQSGQLSDDPALAGFQPFMSEMGFSTAVLSALLDGLLQDQKDQVCLSSEEDLLRYSYRVAGTVGLLMCEVLNSEISDAKLYAIDLGIAMQLTNIARDILEDARMGRRYIPADWVNGLSPAAICQASEAPDSKNARKIKAAVVRLLELAESFYQSGARGYPYLPWRAHLGIAVAARVYRQIGIQLENTGYAWHLGRQVTSKTTKLKYSLVAIGSLFSRLPGQNSGYHNRNLHSSLQGLPYVN